MKVEQQQWWHKTKKDGGEIKISWEQVSIFLSSALSEGA